MRILDGELIFPSSGIPSPRLPSHLFPYILACEISKGFPCRSVSHEDIFTKVLALFVLGINTEQPVEALYPGVMTFPPPPISISSRLIRGMHAAC